MTAPKNNEYRKRYPQKQKAHCAVANALKSSRLVKPDLCEMCGSNAKVEGHHDDYAKVLEIVWVCKNCHEDIHHPKRKKVEKKQPYKSYHTQYQPAPKRDEFIETARKLRAEGLSYERIGGKIGVSIGTVYKWLNDVRYN